jgi:PAS domain S-box-containing protein
LFRLQENLEEAQRIAKVGGWEYIVKTNELHWTKEVYRIHELPEDYQPVVSEAINFYAPESRPTITWAFEEAMKNGKPYDLELSLITAKGNHLWVRAIGQPHFKNGEIYKVTGVFQDITEQIQARQERDRMFSLSIDMICIAGFDGYFIELNPAWSQTLGWSDNELLSKPYMDFVHPEDIQATIEAAQQLSDNNPVISFENRYQCKDGSYRWLAWNSLVLPNERVIFAIARDVSQQKETEKMLRDAKEQAETANRAKSTFLANMSHELRTPLNAVIGFSQLMQRDSSLTPSQSENLSIINRSGEHLLALINDVLEMSKIEAGRAILNEVDFDLHHLLNDVYNMFRLRVEDKGLKLTINRSADVPRYIHTDEGKLRQVLINLLNNSVKFTREGSVTLHVDSLDYRSNAPRLKIYSISFEVEDTGVGIAAEELDNLFTPFVQTASGRESQQGTGLGLAISQQFVHLMGGEVDVSSQINQGTKFSFHIQATLAQPTDVEQEKHHRRVIGLEANQPVYRLLIVDDRSVNRQLLIKLLEPLGFELREAGNGMEALTEWKEWQPHLIFMDIQMSVMDGYEAIKQIKSIDQKTVIIALTASVFEEQQLLVSSTGCEAFIPKPFKEDDIFDKMAEYIGVRYIYETMDNVTTSLDEKSLSVASLKVLPTEWLKKFHQATLIADFNRQLVLVEQIQPQHPNLAKLLTELVNDFAYDELIELTEGAQ